MANTTNYNWETPDDTDLVKDGAAAIRTLGSSIDTTTKNLNPETTLGDIAYRSATANTNTRLAIGTTGQVLTVAGGVPTWATSDDANAIQNAIVDAKGDIVAASAADTPARLAVGTDNQRLVAASGETTGLKYVSDTQNTVIDAEGDLLIGDAADALQRLAIGSNAQVLTVDTTVDGKIKWATPAGGGGKVLQVVSGTYSTAKTIASTSLTDTDLTLSITPTLSTSKILVMFSQNYWMSNTSTTNTGFSMVLKRGSTTVFDMNQNGYNTRYVQPEGTTSIIDIGYVSIQYLDSPATTSSTAYKTQARLYSTDVGRQVIFNSNSSPATMILMEIGA
jgi:hypothetical protein